MFRRSSRKYIYLGIIVTLIVLICQNILRNYKNETQEVSDTFERDFVLSDVDDDVPIRDVKATKQVFAKTNKVNVFTSGRNSIRDLKTGQLAYLKAWKGRLPVYVHPRSKDAIISARISDLGTWEDDLLNETGLFLERHKPITFIDLGCNIGVYTLFASTFGVQIVAVDPLKDNLELLEMTLHANRIQDNITLVLNAVSDTHQTVYIETPSDNVGGAHIVGDLKNKITKSQSLSAETITLDDLIPYVENKKVLIKMDIEGHEWNALQGSKNFFQSKNVKGILMEWVHHRYTETGGNILDYLLKEGLLPYTDVTMNTILDSESYYKWPENVFWIKR
ncbi:hypothetical protein ACF0H5_004593 [Mactra antiquata]